MNIPNTKHALRVGEFLFVRVGAIISDVVENVAERKKLREIKKKKKNFRRTTIVRVIFICLVRIFSFFVFAVFRVRRTSQDGRRRY